MLLRIPVHAASWLVDDPFILEVGGERVVIRGQCARAADDCQGQNMVIVGCAPSCGVQTSRLDVKLLRVSGSQPSSPLQCHKAPSHIGIEGELLEEFAGGNQFWISAFPKKPSDDGARLREV